MKTAAISSDASWRFWKISGEGGSPVWAIEWQQLTPGTNDYLRIGEVSGGEGRVQTIEHWFWNDTFQLDSGSKITLSPEFGGGTITVDELDLAAKLANYYWGLLADKGIQVTDSQFRQPVKVFLLLARDTEINSAFSKWLTGQNTTDFPILLDRWCRSHPDLVAGLPIWSTRSAPPPDRMSPWYKTEDEAQVAAWLSMLHNGDYGMAIAGPGGMGETGLLAATPFAKGSVISPMAPIAAPPEEPRNIGPVAPGEPIVAPGERGPSLGAEPIVPPHGDRGIWDIKSDRDRGIAAEDRLGGRTGLDFQFPIIDRFENGVATSVKTMDLTRDSYQTAQGILSRGKQMVNEVADFAKDRPVRYKGRGTIQPVLTHV